MCLVVYLGQMLEVKVCIDLRRADVGVAEKFLHAAQVVAGLEEMRREGMPKQVRVNARVDALPARPVVDAGLHGSRADTLAALADENRTLVDIGEGGPLLEPGS